MISLRRGVVSTILVTTVAAVILSLGAYWRFGEPARFVPEVAFVDADGQRRSITEYRGRYVLLNVWATWCPPCVKEMPALDRLQALKGNAQFEVVALSVDRKGMQLVRDFYQRVGLRSLGIYLDQDGRSMSSLRITGLPTTLLVDPSGREIARWAGMREWDSPEIIRDIEKLITQAGAR